MDRILRQAVNGLSLLGITLLGAALSLALYQVWQFETRWAFVVVMGIAAVSVSMRLVRIFSEFLLAVLMFSLPFVSLGNKWLQLDVKFYAGFYGVNLIDFLLIGLYVSWFYRVFVTREQAPPSFNRLDILIVWYFAAHVISTIFSDEWLLGFGAVEFLIKFLMFYFYLSRHLDERYMLWLLGALAFTIMLEGCLGFFQFSTGRLVGLAIDKGAGNPDQLNFQYQIPGAEGYTRATGTTFDSHTFGHYMGLLLPFPLMLVFMPGLRPAVRFVCLVATGAALMGVLLSLSRSAWLACAIALPIGIMLMILLWRERHLVPALAGMAVLLALLSPLIGAYVYNRFAGSPLETIGIRVMMYYVAWRVFTIFPLFGVGPGTWYTVFDHYDYLWQEIEMIHNVILVVAVELGLFGLLAYLGMIGAVMLRFFGLARRRRDITGRLALAGLTSLMITLLDGLAEPTFREPNVFLMFWVLVTLGVVLPRMPPGAFAVLMAPLQPAAGPVAVPGMVPGGGTG